jgi:hypothetical protein
MAGKSSKSAAQRRAEERRDREKAAAEERAGQQEGEYEVSGSMSVHPAAENAVAESRPASGGPADTDPAGDLESRGPAGQRAEDERTEQEQRGEDTRTEDEKREDEAVTGPRYPDGAEGELGQSVPLEGLPGSDAITGEAPMAAWPPVAERAASHRLLVTSPGEGADASADLAGATPYANWLESREGPNGTTWLVTVGYADRDNFLAQCEEVGATVQLLEGDGSVVSHVQGDEGAGWVHPADRDPEAEAAARREGERARDEDEADEESGGEDREDGDSPQKD